MRMRRVVKAVINAFGYNIARTNSSGSDALIKKPTDTSYLEILSDSAFQASVDEVRDLTILDTARLANLWQLCKISNPVGSIIEIGSYRGGAALHMSNSCPNRRILVCDTFDGFENMKMDNQLDRLFSREDFRDTDLAFAQAAWKAKNRDVTWIEGQFPNSATDFEIGAISFAHVDVDLYQSTFDTLEFLSSHFIDRSLIVLDDYLRSVHGVMQASRDFCISHPEWICLPIYPGQGLMIHRSWYGN